TTPFRPSTATATRPSAATRPDFFAALESPFLRSQSIAASTSPPVSPRAFLQSMMPAPVLSRRSFTIAAVTFVMLFFPYRGAGPAPVAPDARPGKPAHYKITLALIRL